MFKHFPQRATCIALFLTASLTLQIMPVAAATAPVKRVERTADNKVASAPQPQAAAPEAQANGSRTSLKAFVSNDDQPLLPMAATITATLTDNVSAATKVAPGAAINYTAVITNTGATGTDDASAVNYSHIIGANTTLVNGSVHASPVAFNNAFTTAVGNTLLEVSNSPSSPAPKVTAAGTLFDNDTISTAPDTIQLASFTAASANGGTVSVNADGSFTYLPPAGFTGSDTFTYTIRNSADASLTDTGTVTITVNAPRVWYVDNSGANGDGRSTSPFNTLTNAAAVDGAGDIIYLFTGAGNYTGGITLLNNEQVIGNGVALVVNTFTLRAAGSRPTVVNAGGNGLTLGLNNTLTGFNFGACTGFAMQGASVGTLAATNMLINNTSGGAMDLTGVTTPSVNVVMDSTTSTGGVNNVRLVGLNGTVTLGSGALSGSTAGATNHAFVNSGGGTAGITFSGSITKANQGNVINIASRTGGAVTLSGAINGSGSNGINVSNNAGGTIDFTNSTKTLNTAANAAVTLGTNTGTTISFTNGGLDIDTTSGAGFSATGGGTINVPSGANPNTIDSATGTALNVANTTIGASGLTFRSISAGNGASGPANGIILNNTGSTAGLTILANGGTCTSAGTCTGGAIQDTSGAGISLTNTQKVVIDRMFIQDTGQSGVGGTQVVDFTFTNSRIDNSGTSFPSNADNDSSIGFGFQAATTENNLSGVVVITGNTLTNSTEHGIDIQNFAGTISNATISSNSITSSTSSGTSHGSGIRLLGFGHAGATSNITKATIASNSIFNFPGGAGITAQYGNNSAGPAGAWGTVGSATNRIFIQNNIIQGQSAANPMNTNAILMTLTGKGQANWLADANGTVGQPIANIGGTEIGVTVRGVNPTATCDITNNRIVGITNVNAQAIAFAADFLTATTDAPQLSGTISGNNVSGQDGEAIQALATPGSTAHLDVSIKNNVTSAPNCAGCNRFGITAQVGSASATVTGAPSMCLDMSGNTAAGSGVNTGIGIRKKTAAYVFQIEGFAGGGDPTAFLTAANPAGGGVIMISQTTGFGNCSSAPIPPPGEDSAMNKASCSSTLTAHAATPAMFGTMAQPKTLSAFDTSLPRYLNNVAHVTASAQIAATERPLIASDVPARTSYRATISNAMHHAFSTIASAAHSVDSLITPTAHAQDSAGPNAPLADVAVAIGVLPAAPAGKSITIKYQVTVNAPPLVKEVSAQGSVSFTGGPGSPVLTTDPGPPIVAGPTKTLVDTLMTWNGSSSTDWNTATNWTQPAGGTQYAPGVSNPAINDVVIPNVGLQPNISATDIGIYSLNISNGRTLTITNPRVLTIGGLPGGDLTLDGIISGGNLNLGNGTHVITNAGGTGSLSSTNVATVLGSSTWTLNNNTQMGALAVNAGGSMTIANQTLSLNGSGGALTVPGGATFMTTASTVVFNGTAGQQAAGIAYNNLTINNSVGLNVTGVTLTGNATVNGTLTLTSSDLSTDTFVLTQPNTTASAGVTDVVGTVRRTGAPLQQAALTYGNPLNTIAFTAAGTRPTQIDVVLAKSVPSGTYLGNGIGFPTAIQRTYTVTPTGGSGYSATMQLRYLIGELNGNTEATLQFWHFITTPTIGWQSQSTSAVNTGNKTVSQSGITTFSPWTMASHTGPTAANGNVSGTILDSNGNPVEGAAVRMNGTQNRLTVTDANGFYHFENVETDGIYTIVPSRANFNFTPMQKSFSQQGAHTEAVFNGQYNGGTANPLDRTEYFVRQQYVDFLNREPDEAGLNFWVNSIATCGGDSDCLVSKRTETSAAFFQSIEFQQTGYLVYRMYQSAYGDMPDAPVPVRLGEFKPDSQAIGFGVIVNAEDWQSKLEANKVMFAESFVQRAKFAQAYPTSLTPDQFVDLLFLHAGVTPDGADRAAAIAEFSSIGNTADVAARGRALRKVAENSTLRQQEFNQAFVLMQYFGYLRRDPNTGPDTDYSGYSFWLNKLESFNGNYGDAEMVKAFLVAGEYRQRFPK